MNEIKRALLDAKALLVTKGWCQGTAVNEAGKHCAIGALRTVTGYGVSAKAEDALEAAVPAGWTAAGLNVIDYNDAAGRTVEDILALYDRAIERAQQ